MVWVSQGCFSSDSRSFHIYRNLLFVKLGARRAYVACSPKSTLCRLSWFILPHSLRISFGNEFNAEFNITSSSEIIFQYCKLDSIPFWWNVYRSKVHRSFIQIDIIRNTAIRSSHKTIPRKNHIQNSHIRKRHYSNDREYFECEKRPFENGPWIFYIRTRYVYRPFMKRNPHLSGHSGPFSRFFRISRLREEKVEKGAAAGPKGEADTSSPETFKKCVGGISSWISLPFFISTIFLSDNAI